MAVYARSHTLYDFYFCKIRFKTKTTNYRKPLLLRVSECRVNCVFYPKTSPNPSALTFNISHYYIILRHYSCFSQLPFAWKPIAASLLKWLLLLFCHSSSLTTLAKQYVTLTFCRLSSFLCFYPHILQLLSRPTLKLSSTYLHTHTHTQSRVDVLVFSVFA